MSFNSLVREVDHTLLDTFGVSATHANGTFTVIIHQVFDEQGQIELRQQMAFCRRSALPSGVKTGDSLTVAGLTFRILTRQDDTEGGAHLLLERAASTSSGQA